MAPTRPMLGDMELQLVQRVDAGQEQTLTQHEVPALEGDFLQRRGRRASRLTLEGVITGEDAADRLKTLREKFRAAAPVAFVADIATATQVGEVLIEELSVRELAGKPARFAYALTLREFIRPPRPQTEEPPPAPIPSIDVLKGTLVIDVVAEGDVDMTNVQVTLEGTNADGTSSTRVVTQRTGNTWTATELEPGNYTARAATLDAEPVTANGSKQVSAGQTAQLTLTLRRGAPVATMFVVHFRFDRAFVEPCARNVLRQVRDFAVAHTDQKLLIVGHTDRTGSGPYNQSLSERRARAVHAFLTFGRDQAAADASVAEWNELRRRRRPPGAITTVNDNWETELRQAQHMLQDLGDYPGNVDNVDGPLTREAIRAFRCRKGLPPGTALDDDVWEALVRDYMAQDAFAVPADQFLPNCQGEVLKWLGCGEEDPVNNTPNAFRPSRRVELLFVSANSLPCQVPQPDTFNLPRAGAVNNGWCVGPAATATSGHSCFVNPRLPNPRVPPSNSPTGPWNRQPAEPGSINVQGNISFENGAPAAAQPFVLIAPNGEFVTGELGNGEPNTSRTTDAAGNFSFADKTRGFYHLEVLSPPNRPLLVRLAENGDETVRGNAVCKALRDNNDRLNALIVNAPTIREIRIPAAAHLMTALHPTTRAVRTCPAAVGPALPQRTAHSAADVRSFFDAANRVWRQARIRLVLQDADIVSEAYAFRVDCEVDSNEFVFILERCAYPNTANFFFFGDLSGFSEAGVTVQAPLAGPRVSVEGCAVSDRFQFAAFTPPLDLPLNAAQSEQTLAHEFGHFLNLSVPDHVQNTAANSDRLMLAGTADGSNRTLVQTEVAQARTSNNADLDCLPLGLNVTGATRIGGARSHEFMVLQDAAAVVTIDAVINPRLIDPAVGSVAIVGGLPGANPLQRTVSRATNGRTEIVATYTPVRGGSPVINYVTIFVVTFRLRVVGAAQVGGPAGTTFIASDDPNAVVTVNAEIDPQPFCVPFNLVSWTGGTEASDPLRRTVSGLTATPVTVQAALLGTSQSVSIIIVAFELRVEGALQMGDRTSTTFAALVQAGQVVTLIADVTPLQPTFAPPNLVNWVGGTAVPGDPLRRTVARAAELTTNVSATVGNTTRRVTIQVIGDPSLPGPFAVGELEYAESAQAAFNMPAQGTFTLPGPDDAPMVPFSVRRRALIRYPASAAGVNQPVSAAQSTYPLVVILHGNHRRVLDDGTTFVESYRGHEYIARHLASRGYVAISIDVDDINARDDLIRGRGRAIIEHLGVMRGLNTTHPTLNGKIDLTNIGLVGHSRGGEGVVAAEQLNVRDGLGHQIKAVVSIAPTNSEDFRHSTTPYLVLYGTSDGDVSGESDGGNPFLLYDRASPPKAMVFVYGAIHNRFSTNADWLAARFIDNDDARMISEADHQNVAKGFCLAFFERHLRNVAGHDLFFNNNARPQSVAAVEMHHQYQHQTRSIVDNFEQPPPDPTLPLGQQLAARASTNTLTLGVTATGLSVPGGVFTNALTEASLKQADTTSFVHDSFGVMIAWDSTAAVYTSTLGTLDASSFQVLSFRVTQRLGSARNPANAAQDFFVRLTDTANRSAAIRVGTATAIPAPFIRHDHDTLHPPPLIRTRLVDRRPDRPSISKSALKTIRLRLDDFKAANAQLNLSSLQTLAFEFRQTARGEVALDDIEFSI